MNATNKVRKTSLHEKCFMLELSSFLYKVILELDVGKLAWLNYLNVKHDNSTKINVKVCIVVCFVSPVVNFERELKFGRGIDYGLE